MTDQKNVYSGLMASIQEFGAYIERNMYSEAYLDDLVDRLKAAVDRQGVLDDYSRRRLAQIPASEYKNTLRASFNNLQTQITESIVAAQYEQTSALKFRSTVSNLAFRR